MVYNHKPSMYFHPVVVTKPGPLYPFGHGLSYTTYTYSPVTLDRTEIAPDGTLTASVDVTNTGDRPGDEIVQLYLRDDYSSVTRPVKELKDFARISLQPGQTRTVRFTITPDKLRFLDEDMQPVVEPGTFTVMIGPSSDDKDLKTATFTVK